MIVIRKHFKAIRPKIMRNYRCFKQFSNEAFKETLKKNLSNEVFAHNNQVCNGFVDYVLKP